MDQATVFQLLARLGVTAADLSRIQGAPYPASARLLAELKARVGAAWKKLAFELHPDRNGGSAEKTELFKQLVQVVSNFNKLNVEPVAPAAIPVGFVPVTRPTYAATPFSGFFGKTQSRQVHPWHFVTMKP